jgi:hypothetical protein
MDRNNGTMPGGDGTALVTTTGLFLLTAVAEISAAISPIWS